MASTMKSVKESTRSLLTLLANSFFLLLLILSVTAIIWLVNCVNIYVNIY
jgi:hypothetical protein